ncbi:MAG: matrixin family metalloprotease, partial [Myxococcales bacterium]|nr:matrixin family metalloprotease [Myxococcales bacterium]
KSSIQSAFASWQAVPTSYLQLRFEGTKLGEREGYVRDAENYNVVRFEEAAFGYEDSVLAVTLLTFESSSGIILDADIVVNGENHTFTTDGGSSTHDLENTMAHEVGHFVGLAHETGDAAATMFPSAPPGETSKRTLSQDDQQGISFLYPSPTNPPVQSQPGDNGEVTGGSGSPPPGALPDTTAGFSQEAELDQIKISLGCSQTRGAGSSWLWIAALAFLFSTFRSRHEGEKR